MSDRNERFEMLYRAKKARIKESRDTMDALIGGVIASYNLTESGAEYKGKLEITFTDGRKIEISPRHGDTEYFMDLNVDRVCDPETKDKLERYMERTANFGLMYGGPMEPATEEKMKKMAEDFDTSFPKVAEFRQRALKVEDVAKNFFESVNSVHPTAETKTPQEIAADALTDQKCEYGPLSDLNKLPVGTRFEIINGVWIGRIIFEAGKKYVYVEAKDRKFVLDHEYLAVIKIVGDDYEL